jgi:hypothetical protein
MNGEPSIFIIEGIDNVGKGTLIETINDRLGFHQTIKFDKPKRLQCYNGNLQTYQRESFKNSFGLIQNVLLPQSKTPKLIFDRFHLGELVYSPLYRGYSGDYVFEMEKLFFRGIGVLNQTKIRLVLLVASNPGKLPDDGKSFDVSKANNEQAMFIDGFNRSIIKNKAMVYTQDANGSFRDPLEIFKEAVWS